MNYHPHQACIDACVRCARECEHCRRACEVADDAYARIECIRLNKDCAEMCWTTAAYMLRESRFMEEACKLCADICDASTVECDRFAEEHCVHCSAACRDCAAECRRMMEVPVVQAV